MPRTCRYVPWRPLAATTPDTSGSTVLARRWLNTPHTPATAATGVRATGSHIMRFEKLAESCSSQISAPVTTADTAVRADSACSKRPCSTSLTKWSMPFVVRVRRVVRLFSSATSASSLSPSRRPSPGVAFLQLKSHTRTVTIRAQHAAGFGLEHPVEEQLLDAHVVVEVLEMAEAGHGRAHLGAHLGGAMGRHVDAVRLGQSGRAEEAGDPATAGHVHLQAVDGAALEPAPEVEEVPAVLAGGHVHPTRRPVAHEAQPFHVVGAHRFLEPAHAVVAVDGRPFE